MSGQDSPIASAERESRHWQFALAALLVYAFLYDNANSLPGVLGYGWTRLTHLPRQVRLVEIVVVAALLWRALRRSTSLLTQHLLIGVLAFSGIALLSYGFGPNVPPLDALRLVYMFVLPVCVFVIAKEAAVGWRAWEVVTRIALGWTLASALVSIVQVLLGFPIGDDVTGLNKDAHANGTLMMIMALQLIAIAMFLRSRKAALLGLFFLVVMVLSSVLKTMFLGVAAAGVLLVVWLRSSVRAGQPIAAKIMTWSAFSVTGGMLVFVVFSRVDLLSYQRMGDFLTGVQEDPARFGPIRAHAGALAVISGSPRTLFLGLGPFSYANPISVGQVLEQGRLSAQARDDLLAIGDEKGERTRVTLTSSLLAEFGPIAFTLLMVTYFRLGFAVWRAASATSAHVRARAGAALAGLVLLAGLMVTSLFGSIDVLSLSWVVMLNAGLSCRLAALGDGTTAS
jgi:hypothetical protein